MAMRPLTPQEMADLSTLTQKMAHDPRTREAFAQLAVTVDPNRISSFSDVALKHRLDNFERKQEEKRLRDEAKEWQKEQERQRNDLISSGKYTKEQTEEIKGVMDKHGLHDWNAGAVLYSHEHKPSETFDGPPMDQRPGAIWEFPTLPGKDGKPMSFKDFARDPTAAALNAAYTTISEFRRGDSRRR